MAQTYPIDRVILRVDEDFILRGANQRLVIFDARKRIVLSRKPLITIGRDLRYYVVSNANDPRHVTQGEIAGYGLRTLDYNIPVTLAYDARCRPGNEERLVLALFHETDSPGEVLERYVTKWLAASGESGVREFVTRYLENRASLEGDIASRALTDTGLDLKARLSIDPERSLNPIVVAKEHLRAVVCDYHDEEQDLGIRITLDVDERNRVEAILQFRRFQQLHDLVPREVLKHVRQNISLQTFCTDLTSTAVRDRLAHDLDIFLAPYGRKVSTVKLDARPCSLEFFFQDQRDVDCELHEYPKPVVIQNKVQMILEDLAQYKAARSPNLKDWLQKKLDRFIPQLLFKARYINVVLDFDQYELEIKKQLSSEARAIGYRIEQLITVPDLEPIRWKEPFLLDVSDSFETKLPKFFVNVQFVVTARISDLVKVKDFLNREQNVPKLMEEAIPRIARQYLHGVDPERFYMRFNYKETADEKTVEEDLVERVTKELEEKFHAEIIEVVIKVGETDLIARLSTLQKAICPFVVEMKSLHFSEVLVFRGNFQVEAVDADGWHKFQSSTASVEEIANLLEEHISAELHAASPDLILYRDPLHRKQIEAQIVGLARKFVRNVFGLAISVTNVRRDSTPQELEANERRLLLRGNSLKVETARIEAWAAGETATTRDQVLRLEGYLDQRRLLAASPGTEEEIEEIDKKIGDIRIALAPQQMPNVDQVDQLLLPAAPRTTFSDLSSLTGIPDFVPPQMKPQIEGDVE